IALATLSILSVIPSVQYQLLDQRVRVQSDFRRLTQQFPNYDPSILLIYIDSDYELDRKYLAKLIDHTAKIQPRIVGVDYLLYEGKPHEDQELAGSLLQARNSSETLYIFLTSRKDGQRHWTLDQFAINQKWQGDSRIWRNGRYMTLLPLEDEDRPFPFSYLLALAHKTGEFELTSLHKIHPDHLTDKLFERWMRPSPLTLISYRLNQYWLHPIVDFSIPPEYIYSDISAEQFLQTEPQFILTDSQPYPVVIIVPGGYDSAGINHKGEDNLPPPIQFCNPGIGIQTEMRNFCRTFVGGEVHAYLFHHFLKQKPVIPIPDLWLLWLFALATKSIIIIMEPDQLEKKETLVVVAGGTLVYGFVSLQLYISGSILLPILIPVTILWIYLFAHPNSKQI
ncbi:MAG: CHASE2 domain-containing protein, partial [Cyanobacteria bacterium J06592_8]